MKGQVKGTLATAAVLSKKPENGHAQNNKVRHSHSSPPQDAGTQETYRPVNHEKAIEPSTTPMPKKPLSFVERQQLMTKLGKEFRKNPNVRILSEKELRDEDRYYRFYGDPDSDFGKD